MRARWTALIQKAADDAGVPTDAEFRAAFVAYIEWGSRLARLNSNADPAPELGEEPMPAWGWGVPGGPYNPPSTS